MQSKVPSLIIKLLQVSLSIDREVSSYPIECFRCRLHSLTNQPTASSGVPRITSCPNSTNAYSPVHSLTAFSICSLGMMMLLQAFHVSRGYLIPVFYLPFILLAFASLRYFALLRFCCCPCFFCLLCLRHRALAIVSHIFQITLHCHPCSIFQQA